VQIYINQLIWSYRAYVKRNKKAPGGAFTNYIIDFIGIPVYNKTQ
jgi:hypothetical protein